MLPIRAWKLGGNSGGALDGLISDGDVPVLQEGRPDQVVVLLFEAHPRALYGAYPVVLRAVLQAKLVSETQVLCSSASGNSPCIVGGRTGQVPRHGS